LWMIIKVFYLVVGRVISGNLKSWGYRQMCFFWAGGGVLTLNNIKQTETRNITIPRGIV